MPADNFWTNIDACSMASNSFLTEDDVPGAKFIHPSIKDYSDGLNVGVLPQLGREFLIER